ncbi:bifunctional metallophosphatase/5'-nucleotidase, partial [Bacillus thuringiensis]|nr:bifunctional metallophosphatase/5'-nucleotidase [Bacillus thuringiensis]
MQFILFIFATEPPSKLSFVVEVSRIISYIFKVQTTLRKYKKGRNIIIMQKMKWKNYVCYFVILLLLGTAVIVKPPISKAEESEVYITWLGTADIHGRVMPWEYALDGAHMSGSLT